jgi:hypothetical protein
MLKDRPIANATKAQAGQEQHRVSREALDTQLHSRPSRVATAVPRERSGEVVWSPMHPTGGGLASMSGTSLSSLNTFSSSTFHPYSIVLPVNRSAAWLGVCEH